MCLGAFPAHRALGNIGRVPFKHPPCIGSNFHGVCPARKFWQRSEIILRQSIPLVRHCGELFGVGLCGKIQPRAIDVYPCAMAGFLAIGVRPPDAVETPACDRRSEFRLFEIWDSDDRLGFQKLEMPAGWLPGLTIIR